MTTEARRPRLFNWRQKAILGISFLVVIALIPILFPIPVNFARGWLASTTSDALGLEVLISGPMRLQLGLHPELSVADVAFRGAGGEVLASLQHASVKLSLTHILRGEIWLDRLEVASASIEACAWIIDEDDATDPEPAIIPPLVVEQLLANDIEVTCAGDEGKPGWQTWIDHMQGALSANGDGSLLLSGTLAENEIDFGLSAGSVVQFINGLRPLELQFEGRFGTTNIAGKGKATDVDDVVAELALSVEDENPLNLLETFGVSASALGPLVASGMATLASNGMGISGLQLALGNSLFSGGIDMDWAAAKLRLDIDLQVAALEVTPLLSLDVKSDPNSNDEPDIGPEVYFNVSVDRVIEYPWIEQATASGSYLSDIIELASLEVNAYESHAKGRLQVGLQAKCPQLSFELDAESIPLELPATDWLPEEPITGVVGSAAMKLITHGCDVEALGSNLAATLRLAETTISYDGDSSAITGATLMVSHQPEPGLQLEASGVVMGLPLQATARADALSSWLEKSELAYQVQLEAPESHVSVQGQLQQVGDSTTTNGSIVFNSDRVGALSHWLGTNAQSKLKLRGDSSYTVTTEEIVLSRIAVTAGKSDVQGSAKWTLADDQLDLELRSKVLAPEELQDGIADAEPMASKEEAFDLDRVLMPLTLDSPSITLIYSADQLESTPLAVSDLQLAATIEGGFLPELSFSLEVEDMPVSGRLSIMAPGGETEIDLQLSASRIDSEKTAEKLQLAVPFRVTADSASVDVSSRGASLRQMLAKSTVSFEATAVSVDLSGDSLKAQPDLYLDTILARSEKEEPVTLTAQGSYGGEVVRLAMQGDSLLDLVVPNEKLTFEGNMHFAKDNVEFHAALAPPSRGDLDVKLSVSGPGLTLYETEGDLALALADPYHIEGRLEIAEDVLTVNDIRARVGNSSLAGSLAWVRTKERDAISGRLQTEAIELSDFLVPLPSNRGDVDPKSSVEQTVSDGPDEEVFMDELSTSLEQIAQAMKDYDIDFSLNAAEVRSNGVPLGGGKFGVLLNDDTFNIRVVKLNSDVHDLLFELNAENLGGEWQVALRTQVERLDYAALFRNLDAMDDSQGWVYADIDLQARAPSTEDLLQNVSGHFDVAIWPQGVYSPLFDIWVSSAIEVLLSSTEALLSSTEETDERGSALNCIVARFDVEEGVMTPVVIMLDSSNNNVLGEGYISLADQNLDLVFSPWAKTKTFFSVATPIRILGPWNEFYVDLDYGSVPITLLRWYLNLVYVPLQNLFGERLPEDGVATCRKAMRRSS